MTQPCRITVHYHEDGGQMCGQAEPIQAVTQDEAIIHLLKLIKAQQDDRDHFCRNGGIKIEIEPLTRAIKP